ncbi:MAG: peptidyl-prolyl cis-trans isomerase [Phycisphaerales bacterium]|nr:peptidyl-prolyl cis-trans isomerase [Phycisphaerales bacterium]
MRTGPIILVTLALAGCQGHQSVNVPTRPSRQPSALPATAPSDARPLALLDQDPVALRDMRVRLLEASGGEVIRELRLEHALQTQLDRESIEITDAAIEAEEARLLAELDDDRDVALRLLQNIRDAQGLGPARYRSLLWRNAALRALVQPHVAVDEDAMRLVWEISHGPKVRVRVIAVSSFSRAAAIAEQLEQGAPFDRLAVDWSTDPSRDRGGLLDVFSTADPSFPTALRQAIDELESGEHTNPVLLGDRYVVALLEERLPADAVTFDSIQGELQTRTRLSQERLLMQEEAYRLRNEPSMRLFDETLEASYLATDPERPSP